MTQEAQYHRIPIENEPLLTNCGFTEFRLPLNGNATKMVLYNDNFKSMITYADWDKHNTIDKAVKLLRDKLLDEQSIRDKRVIESLCSYFRNACVLLSEDPDVDFFKSGKSKKKSRKRSISNKKSRQVQEQEQEQEQFADHGDGSDDEVGGGSSSTKPSEAEIILSVIQNDGDSGGGLIHELFLDQYSTPYASIKVGDHVETISMRTKASTQMKNWICYNLYKQLRIVPKDESLNSVLNILRAKASYEGKVRKLYLRAGPGDKPDEILYDLTNKDWEFVRITPEGWSIEKSSTKTTPVFKRYRNQLAQVCPSKEYASDIFDQFMKLLNVKDASAVLLLKVYIILLIYYKIQKPILAPHGEQGSAKSTLHEYIKQLIDPSAAVTLAFPRDVNELVQKLDHNYIAYFDNISKIPEWISDQFCRAVTGSGFSKRQLYTDEDDIIFSFKRSLGFNGINLAATKADLLDRCLIIMLERIKEDKRKPLEDIVNIKGLNQELERIKPQLLGFIFDILAKVLKMISTTGITKPKELPRMADFAIHGEIVARCLGYDKNIFLNAFNENIRLQSDELIESNPLAMTIFQFIQWKPEFKGTATKLLGELNLKAAELGIQTDKFWPKGPGALSRKLNLIRTSLRRIGVDIEFYEHQGESGKSRGIKVCKISSQASVTSDIEPNQTRINNDVSDDIMDDTNKISSEGLAKNHAKSGTSDDTIDTDGILHTLQVQDFGRSVTNIEESMTTVRVPSYSCYYYDYTTYNKDHYERHVILRHSGKPAYPNKAEIEKRGLKPQGKPWEI